MAHCPLMRTGQRELGRHQEKGWVKVANPRRTGRTGGDAGEQGRIGQAGGVEGCVWEDVGEDSK